MRRRRPLLILLVAFVLLSGALGAAERDRTRTASKPPATVAPATPARPAPAAVEATLPAGEPVRARVGDTVVLRVRSATPDTAAILALGVKAPVGPGLPGRLEFTPATTGKLAVMLQIAGRSAGGVIVGPAR